jgi:hypothetical protein
MDEIISYKMCAVKVRNAKLRNYLKYCWTAKKKRKMKGTDKKFNIYSFGKRR